MEHDVLKTAEPKFENLRFHGEVGAYFKIWIVNLVLTIVTLGIYSPWAKIRTLKFMNQATEFKGARMDFHAKPLPILFGRIIAVLIFLVYVWGGKINPLLGVLGAIFCFLPYPFSL